LRVYGRFLITDSDEDKEYLENLAELEDMFLPKVMEG
jgi:hypothetical protein